MLERMIKYSFYYQVAAFIVLISLEAIILFQLFAFNLEVVSIARISALLNLCANFSLAGFYYSAGKLNCGRQKVKFWGNASICSMAIFQLQQIFYKAPKSPSAAIFENIDSSSALVNFLIAVNAWKPIIYRVLDVFSSTPNLIILIVMYLLVLEKTVKAKVPR